VRLARQISHPNICRVYDIAETDGHHFLSMEYVDGEDLASLLRRVGRFPPDRAAEVAQQLCSGLAAAHERGVLHLDLKPANVMIDGRGQVIIHDFGLASLIEQIPGNPLQAGTPGYMAPEQWTGGRVSTRTDLYSLGLVLYEVFTGRAAFPDETLSDLLRRDPRGSKRPTPAAPSTLVDGMDPAVERVIQQCLSEDPRTRPESVMEIMAELPGGDPLAAAMRSGKTLSPEMVAAAPGGRPLTPLVAAAVFLLGVAGLVANVVLSGRLRVLERLTLPKPPEVMVDHAEGVIERLGHGQKRAYSAWGLDYNLKSDGQILSEAEARERSRAGAEAGVNAATEIPPAIVFWYRQAASPLVPSPTGVDFAAAKATYDDPPPLSAGMTSLKLDPQGRLLEFVAVQPPVAPGRLPPRDGAAPVLRPEWGRVLAEAHLELAELTEARPAWAPPVACDARVAWEATFPGQKSAGTRVEAAARDGKVVWFRVLRPADIGQASWFAGHIWSPPQETRKAAVRAFISTSVYVATLLGGAVLAFRNFRLARADRKGTARLAVFVFGVFMLNWALAATHATSYTEEFFNVALPAVAKALLWTAVLWVCYVALEPHVRRIWPHRLVSWTRLLNGRWRDPLVGRDVLIGCAAGVVLVPTVGMLDRLGASLQGLPERVPMGATSLQPLLGVRFIAERVGIDVVAAIHWAMLFLFVPVLLKLAVRKVWLAVGLAFVLWTLKAQLDLDRPFSWWDLLCQSLATAVPLFIAIRYGFLSIAAACVGMFLLWDMPITLRYSEWYSGVSLFAILLLGALLCTGLYFAVRVKPTPALAAVRAAPELA
jgi:serine/threonine-protein kinase